MGILKERWRGEGMARTGAKANEKKITWKEVKRQKVLLIWSVK